MRVNYFSNLSFLVLVKQASAGWSLEFFTSGCPAPGEIGNSVGLTAGGPDDELWCIQTASAHDVIATGIASDGMQVTMFSDFGCTAVITEFNTDGCKVIPSDTVVNAVKVLPQ